MSKSYKRKSNKHYKNYNKKYNKSTHKKRGVSLFRFGKGIQVTFLYIVTFLFMFLIYFALQNLLNFESVPYHNIIAWFILLSGIVIGFYDSYRLVKYIERKLGRSDLSIWFRRIIATIMSGAGIILSVCFGFVTSFLFAALVIPAINDGFLLFVIFPALEILFGISLGMIFFSAYLEFSFERKSGYIMYHGKQHF